MNILTCWVPGKTEILPQVDQALRLHSTPDCNWRRVELDPEDPHAYGRVIQEFWRAAEDDLLVLEPDIEVGPSTIYDMRACQYGYCSATYPWLTDVGPALGCTRFRRQFMVDFPTVVDEVVALNLGFRQFDVALQRLVLVRKFRRQPHIHASVVHHNSEKALMSTANPEPLRELPGY